MDLTKGQQIALEAALNGENIFLTGGGGVGKSYLVNKIMDALTKSGKNVLLTASTGRAAQVIGGVTCHRAFRIPIKITWHAKPRVDSNDPVYHADVVIVDEISMLRIDAFEFLIQTLEFVNERRKLDKDVNRTKPIQLILVGDFFQLPPVIIRPPDGSISDKELMDRYYGFNIGAGYAFTAPGWKRYNLKTYELTEAVRQKDAKFVAALSQLRYGDPEILPYFQNNSRKQPYTHAESIVLCGKNATAERINRNVLKTLPGDMKIYNAEVSGEVQESDKMAPDKIYLKSGARVVMLQNTEDYVNGSTGIVVDIHSRSITVKIDDTGETVDVAYVDWPIEKYIVSEKDQKVKKVQVGLFSQLPLRVGYAITIHKSQGQTYDHVTLVPEIFVPGQLYVGLSRIRNVEELYTKTSHTENGISTLKTQYFSQNNTIYATSDSNCNAF